MKVFFCLLILFCISSCVVQTYAPDFENDFKKIQTYQKKDSIGKTNYIQRIKDVKDCGVINLDSGGLDVNVMYKFMTDREFDERINKFSECMKKKDI